MRLLPFRRSRPRRSTRIAEKTAARVREQLLANNLELKQLLLEARHFEENSFVLSHSMERLAASPAGGEALAVASIMPPVRSGVATFTLRTFRDSPYPVDIFTRYSSAQQYLTALSDRSLEGSRIRIFDIATLPVAVSQNRYRSQLYVLGNSWHNVPVARALRMVDVHSSVPVSLLIHDPHLAHLCWRTLEGEEGGFEEAILGHYGAPAGDDLDLLQRGIHCLRPLVGDAHIKAVFVNSKTASEFMHRELPDVRVHQLFHPVFTPRGRGHARTGLRIGTFGVPGKAKLTELVLEAFDIVRRSAPDARLIIAGWSAAKYAQAHDLRNKDGVEIHDCLSDAAIENLIATVDVGVQLRWQNTGESSGAVAQLLAQEKPVIVTEQGSFSEYGRAVRSVPLNCTAQELAEVMIAEREITPARRSEIRRYVADHSARKFCELIGRALLPVTELDEPGELRSQAY